MRMRNLVALFCLLLLSLILVVSQEPVKPKLNPRIITATRQAALFSGLEKQLLQAIQKKDKPALQNLLTDDFEIFMPDADPLPGDDWLDEIIAQDFSLKSFIVRQLSVTDQGDSAVVSFDRVQQAAYKGRSESGEFFVVDLWKKSGDSWKLSNRYVVKVSDTPENVKPQARPTGKE